jgi:hypothetical protein
MAKPKKEQAPKEETPPKSPPATNVSESLLLQHIGKMVTAEKKQGEATAALRNARKHAKSDGVNLDALDKVRSMIKRDIHENVEEFNAVVNYSKILNAPIYSQLDMFSAPEPTEEEVMKRAYADGVRSGKLGESEGGNPFDDTHGAGQEWLSGFRDGQKILMQAFAETSGHA